MREGMLGRLGRGPRRGPRPPAATTGPGAGPWPCTLWRNWSTSCAQDAQRPVLDGAGQALPRRAVADAGDGHRGVRPPRPVGELHEVEEAGVVPRAELGHPPVPERRFELVFAGAPDPVHLVEEQHGYAVTARTTPSTAASARARISSSVRSWIGCGDEHPGRVGAERGGLRVGRVDELGRCDEHGRHAEGLEVDGVVHTARRAGSSVGERLDHDVALLGDLVAQVDRRRPS